MFAFSIDGEDVLGKMEGRHPVGGLQWEQGQCIVHTHLPTAHVCTLFLLVLIEGGTSSTLTPFFRAYRDLEDAPGQVQLPLVALGPK